MSKGKDDKSERSLEVWIWYAQKRKKVNQQGKARKVDTEVEKIIERCGGTDNLPAPPTMDHPELRRHSVFSALAVTHECNSTPLSWCTNGIWNPKGTYLRCQAQERDLRHKCIQTQWQWDSGWYLKTSRQTWQDIKSNRKIKKGITRCLKITEKVKKFEKVKQCYQTGQF